MDILGVFLYFLVGGCFYFVLCVFGNLMIEEGIYDGDFVVVWGVDVVEKGEMVVVLIDGEVIFKCYYFENG